MEVKFFYRRVVSTLGHAFAVNILSETGYTLGDGIQVALD